MTQLHVTPGNNAQNPTTMPNGAQYSAAVGQVIQVPAEHAAVLTQRGWTWLKDYTPLVLAGANYTPLSPSTGFSVQALDGTGALLITPAGTLAAGTIIMPQNPEDGALFEIQSTQVVTALTQTAGAGQTIAGGITALAANISVSWRYRAANKTWYRRF